MSTITQIVPVEDGLQATSNGGVMSVSGRSVTRLAGSEWSTEVDLSENVIEYGEGGSVILNSQQMAPGMPYLFQLGGHKVIAIKDDGEAIDFYYLP